MIKSAFLHEKRGSLCCEKNLMLKSLYYRPKYFSPEQQGQKVNYLVHFKKSDWTGINP